MIQAMRYFIVWDPAGLFHVPNVQVIALSVDEVNVDDAQANEMLMRAAADFYLERFGKDSASLKVLEVDPSSAVRFCPSGAA